MSQTADIIPPLRISEWTMSQTADIIPNALLPSPDPAIVVQKKMKNLNVECIVRGYLWGSMAAAYEKGNRTFCGLQIPDGLVRYQKLEAPLFTPTTKAEIGHDENMTFGEVGDPIYNKYDPAWLYYNAIGLSKCLYHTQYTG